MIALSISRVATAAILGFGLILAPAGAVAQIGRPYVVDEPGDEPATETESNETAQADTETDVGLQPATDSPGRPVAFFRELWHARHEALKTGDNATAKKKLKEMVAAKKASGWPDAFVFGRALERESEQARRLVDYEEAVRLAAAAVALAPDAPGPHLTLAGAQWDAGEYLAACRAVTDGILVSTVEPPLLREHLGNTFLALIIGLFVAAVGFVSMSAYRYARPMIHDLRHLLPPGARAWQAGLVAATVFILPVLFRLGVVWVLVWWVVALGVYYRPRERVCAFIILAGMAAVAVFLPRATNYLGYAGSSSQKVYLAARDLGATRLAADLATKPKTTPDERYALGLRAAWSGDPRRAAEWLDAAVAGGAGDQELFTLLGNVRFLLGQPEKAVEAFERAVQVDAGNLIAYFNMSRVYFAMGEHQKGNVAYRKASAIDFEQAELHAKRGKSAGRGYIVPVGVSRRILALDVKPVASHGQAVEEAWGWVASRASRISFAIGTIMGLILLAVMALLHKPLKLAAPCPRCGMAACRRCNPEMPDLGQCGQCYHAFVLKDGVEDKLRIEKEIASHRYRASTARVARLFSVVVAGAGHMTRGASLRGLFLMLVFGTSMTGFLATVGMLPSPVSSADTGLDTVTVVITATVSLVTYVLAFWDGARTG